MLQRAKQQPITIYRSTGNVKKILRQGTGGRGEGVSPVMPFVAHTRPLECVILSREGCFSVDTHRYMM